MFISTVIGGDPLDRRPNSREEPATFSAMSTGKRLAKRSILGTRVCVPGQDGRYYPAVIQASKTSGDRPGPGGGANTYSVVLEDKSSKEVGEKDIIGPGFQPVSGLQLIPGQSVFITHNGREISGAVTSHKVAEDEVLVTIGSGIAGGVGVGLNGQTLEVMKRLEDVRLLESRKSARLQDLDQDYSRLADFGSLESRKRMTSSGIDVPANHCNRKRRPSSSSDVDVLDDCSAAMVLMSLSCSPKSPRLPGFLSDASAGAFFSRSWTDSSVASSSGASSWQSGQSQRSTTPSPPHGIALSESAPSSIPSVSNLQDEGIEMDDSLGFMDEPLPRKRRNSTRTAYQCTWKGCHTVTRSIEAIEKHVRLVHLGRSDSEDGEQSDHEEEFYYTEVEVSVDSVVESFANMHASSPPTLSHMDMARPPYEDPEYQRMLQTSPVKQTKVGTRLLSASPKPSPLRHRKCRKVYGMENRDMWCTQCKWKKACSRFHDVSLPPV